MKKIKNIIIILSILMIIVIVLICLLKINNQKSLNNNKIQKSISEVEIPLESNQDISWLEYDTVNLAVNRFINTINKNNTIYIELQEANEESDEELEKQINQSVLDLISDVYIKNNQITSDNLKKYISLES